MKFTLNNKAHYGEISLLLDCTLDKITPAALGRGSFFHMEQLEKRSLTPSQNQPGQIAGIRLTMKILTVSAMGIPPSLYFRF